MKSPQRPITSTPGDERLAAAAAAAAVAAACQAVIGSPSLPGPRCTFLSCCFPVLLPPLVLLPLSPPAFTPLRPCSRST